MERKIVKQISFVSLIVLMLFFVGCFPVLPISRQSRISEKNLKSIVVGTITKAEIYDLLGKPNCLENERYCVYDLSDWHGGIAILDLTGSVINFGGESYRILLEFNENDILGNYAVEKGEIDIISGQEHGYQNESIVSELPESYVFKEKGFSFNFAKPSPRIAISPNGKNLAVLSSNNTVWLIDLETKEKVECAKLGTIHPSLPFEFSPDSKYLAILSNFVKVIDVSNHSEVIVFKGHGEFSTFWTLKGATCLVFFPDGKKVASGGYKGFVKIWELETGTELMTFKAHEGRVDSIEISPDRKIIATGHFNTIRIWDSTTGTKLLMMSRIGSFKFSPDGKLFVVNCGTHVEMWRINQARGDAGLSTQVIFNGLTNVFLLPIYDVRQQYATNRAIDFSQDGKIVLASYGSAVVYNLEKRESLWRYSVTSFLHSTQIQDAVIHPNDKFLFICTEKGVSLINLKQTR